MNYDRLRAAIAELRETANALESMLPTYEENIVIVDEDFLDRPLPPPARLDLAGRVLKSKEERDVDFVNDISLSLERILRG